MSLSYAISMRDAVQGEPQGAVHGAMLCILTKVLRDGIDRLISRRAKFTGRAVGYIYGNFVPCNNVSVFLL